jgi:hypothetical protein
MAPVIALAAILFLSRLILAILIVPPWQQPDEPIHVAVAELWRGRISGDDAADPSRQAEIIDSMIRHGWWRHYYQQPLPPGPQPTSFVSTGVAARTIGLGPESPGYPPPYYASVGWLFSLAPRGAIERDLYVMRIISMLFGAGTLWVGFLGSRLALDGLGAATVTSLLALHPQVAIVSTTAGPDAVVNFAAAVIWWQTIGALRGTRYVRSLLILWLATVGALVDRGGIALIPIAVTVTAFVMVKRVRFVTAAVALTCMGLALTVALTTAPVRSNLENSLALALVRSSFGDTLLYTSRFVAFLFSSWWYSLGWVRYSAPQWWVAGAAAITAVAAAGTLREFVRSPNTRVVIIFAVLNLFYLLAALAWAFLRVRIGVQGRYLFPAIVPTLTLIWLGSSAWLPTRWRSIGSAALVATFAVLDLSAWILVGLAVYI